jgi:hypothetical protein
MKRDDVQQSPESTKRWEIIRRVLIDDWGALAFKEITDPKQIEPILKFIYKTIADMETKKIIVVDATPMEEQIARIKTRLPKRVKVMHEHYTVEYPSEDVPDKAIAVVTFGNHSIRIRGLTPGGTLLGYQTVLSSLLHEVGHILHHNLCLRNVPTEEKEKEKYIDQFGEVVSWFMIDNNMHFPEYYLHLAEEEIGHVRSAADKTQK